MFHFIYFFQSLYLFNSEAINPNGSAIIIAESIVAISYLFLSFFIPPGSGAFKAIDANSSFFVADKTAT